jgi:hypothetical protein
VASNNPLFNNQAGTPPEVPAPLQVSPVSLPVPQNVPYVQPPNIVPPNIREAYQVQGLNSLAAAFGRQGFGLSGLAEAAMKAAQKKKAEADAQNYYQGIFDMTKRAGTNRDIQADLTRNGWMGASDNKFYQMGYQAMGANALAAQYRNKLSLARMANPTMDPQELQQQVKQDFLGTLEGIRPDIAYQHFLTPITKAEEDDFNAFKAEQTKVFWNDARTKVAQTVDDTFNTSALLYADKKIDAPTFRDQVATTAEEQLKLAYATSMPIQPFVDQIFETITNRAALAQGLDNKMTALSVLDVMKTPDGKSVLNLPGMREKYAKFHQNLIEQQNQEDVSATKEHIAQVEKNTTNNIKVMTEDAASGRLDSFEKYLKRFLDSGMDFDVDKVRSTYSGFSSSAQITIPGKQKVESQNTLMSMYREGASFEELQSAGAAMAANGTMDWADVKSILGMKKSDDDRTKNEGKTGVPKSVYTQFTKTISIPGLSQPLVNRLGFSDYRVNTSSSPSVDQLVQTQANIALERHMSEWKQQNPQAALPEMTAEAESYYDSKVQPKISQIRGWASEAKSQVDFTKRVREVFNPSAQSRVYQAPKPAPAPQPVSPQRLQSKIPWAVDQQLFQQEAQKWRNPVPSQRGLIWEWYVARLRAKHLEQHAEEMWRKGGAASPMGVLQQLQRLNIPTYLGPTNKPQPNQKSMTEEAPNEPTTTATA